MLSIINTFSFKLVKIQYKSVHLDMGETGISMAGVDQFSRSLHLKESCLGLLFREGHEQEPPIDSPCNSNIPNIN